MDGGLEQDPHSDRGNQEEYNFFGEYLYFARKQEEPDRTIYRLVGDLDDTSAPEAENDIVNYTLDHDPLESKVILDLSGIEALDNMGLSSLVNIYRKLRRNGYKCYIRRPSIFVKNALDFTGLVKYLKNDPQDIDSGYE